MRLLKSRTLVYLQLSALFLGIHGGIYTLPIQAISQDRETALEKRLAMRHDRLKSWKARRLAQKSWTTVPADYEIALAGQAGHQDPLGQHKEVNMPERIAPIWDWEELGYVVSMGVGSVPQTLRALLSISDSYSLVLSADCIRGCDSQHAHYALGITSMDSSDNQDATVDFYRCRASGLVMSDHLALGDATIPDQRFLNTRIMQRFTASDWGSDQWDGILGLASSAAHSVHQVNSPFRNLVTQNLLDHNVFSLWLPRDAIEQGELMLGGSNPGIYQGEFRSVPWLTSTENPTNATAWLSGRYRVAANAIDIGSATTRLDGYEAVLETDYPLIGLPRVMMDRIHHHLNFTLAGGPDMPLAIACQDRALLPNITITLANHEFTLTPFDYTLEVDLDKSQMLCLSLFGFREHMPEKTISLGSAFLRNWYTTFDADKRTVAFAALSRTPRVSRGRFANVQ